MHAMWILQHCLSAALDAMHAKRCDVLLKAVEAAAIGAPLTLTELARKWPGAEFSHLPLKALDRLLSNAQLWSEVTGLRQSMFPWLIRTKRPLLLVDWAKLKPDGDWALLRAAVPVGGRALTIAETIFPIGRMGQPAAQAEFLDELKRILPTEVRPIFVTDAGFRSDWYRAVAARGWDYVGWLRNITRVETTTAPGWQPCQSLHALARGSSRDLGTWRIVKGKPMETRLVLAAKRTPARPSGRQGNGATAKKARKRADEPWLLATSLDPETFRAAQIVGIYATRMQIESAFRDLKSRSYGAGFESSLTRSHRRLGVLLLIHALATFAAWLLSLVVDRLSLPDPMCRQNSHRHRYSSIRRAREWLKHDWPARLSAAIRFFLGSPPTTWPPLHNYDGRVAQFCGET
jgi:hypothetical protein